MKVLVEVVATNLNTGHVAINQQVITFDKFDQYPSQKREMMENEFYDQLKKSNYFTPKKVDCILIDRSFLALV